MSPPARSMPHSTTNVPAWVLIVWPLLPGQTTEDVAAGPVEVAVAPAPVVEAAPEVAAPELETCVDGVVVIWVVEAS
jgi:hypothetical protein